MADKTVILRLEVQGFGDAKSDLEFLTSDTAKLTEEKRRLNNESRTAAKVLTAEKGSIEELRARTSLLRMEEAKLGDETDRSGKKRAALRQQIELNTKAIRDHDRQLSGSKTLVGEYEKGFVGAFKSIGAGIAGTGVVVAGLYAGFRTLTDVMKSTEEGADFLEQKVGGLHSAFAVLKGNISGVITDLLKGQNESIKWGSILERILGPAFIATAIQMDLASAAGETYVNSLDQVDDAEAAVMKKRADATSALKAARLALAESNLPAAERISLLSAALEQERKVAAEEQHIAEMRYRATVAYNITLKEQGILKNEDIVNEGNAYATMKSLQDESAGRQMRAAKELKKAKEDLMAADKKAAEDEKKWQEQRFADIEKANAEATKDNEDYFSVNLDQTKENSKDLIVIKKKQATTEEDIQEKLSKTNTKNYELEKQAKLAAVEAVQMALDSSFTNQKNALNERMNAELSNENLTEAQKVEIRKKYAKEQQKVDVKQALINGILSIAKTFATLGWPAGIIPAALAAAQTVIQVAAIKAQKFARGGRITGGAIITPDSTGDNTLVVAKQGEVILNHHQQAAIGGASTFKRLGVPGFAAGGVVGSISQSPGVFQDTKEMIERMIRGFNDKRVELVMSDLKKADNTYNLITKASPI